MEHIEHAHNGCIGHPITNMLMQSAADAPAADSATVSQAPAGDADGAHSAEPELSVEMFEEMERLMQQGQELVLEAAAKVDETHSNTGHILVDVNRVANGLVDLHGKVDRILAHLGIA